MPGIMGRRMNLHPALILLSLSVWGKLLGVLGTFTNMEREGLKPSIKEIVLRAFPKEIPVARTGFVGHGNNARAIVIGREIEIGKIVE